LIGRLGEASQQAGEAAGLEETLGLGLLLGGEVVEHDAAPGGVR
jgi:hypothetical protein